MTTPTVGDFQVEVFKLLVSKRMGVPADQINFQLHHFDGKFGVIFKAKGVEPVAYNAPSFEDIVQQFVDDVIRPINNA